LLDRVHAVARWRGLLYGSGLRLMEAVRLRVKELDFEYMEILVRNGMGEKDRQTSILPPACWGVKTMFGTLLGAENNNTRSHASP
jgi:site-specific recombinase XerC